MSLIVEGLGGVSKRSLLGVRIGNVILLALGVSDSGGFGMCIEKEFAWCSNW